MQSWRKYCTPAQYYHYTGDVLIMDGGGGKCIIIGNNVDPGGHTMVTRTAVYVSILYSSIMYIYCTLDKKQTNT